MFDALPLKKIEQLLKAGALLEAKRLCERVASGKKKDPEVLNLYARVVFDMGAFDEALALAKSAAALEPKSPKHQLILGNILGALGRYNEAAGRYQRVLKALPKEPTAIEGLASVYERRGDPDKAKKLLDPFFKTDTESPQMAMTYATAEQVLGNYDRAIDTISRGLPKIQEGTWIHAQSYYLLGRCQEKRGHVDEAFAAYERANELADASFDPKAYVQFFQSVIDAYSPQTMAALPRPATASELPVFIVGMPRSGSTLVEKIIDAHPQAHGAGELPLMHQLVRSLSITVGSPRIYPECIGDLQTVHVEQLSRTYLEQLERMSPRATRAIDKNLAAYAYLGLIDLLFPGARVIHTRRDPLDTCLSCYAEPLMPGMHPYSCDLEHLAVVYHQQEQLMAHWREVVRIPILEVQYEDMVSDQERVSRQIIEFLGLEWDDRCLSFHKSAGTGRGSSIAPTLSYDQVRRPIYTSSVRRSERFATHLDPLRNALAKLRTPE